MRTRVAGLLGVAILVVSCGGSATTGPSVPPPGSATPGASGTPGASPSLSPTPPDVTPVPSTPAPTAAPSVGPVQEAPGRWDAEAPMAVARGTVRAVRLGDGRVMVVGNDEAYASCVRPDSVESELWDPTSRTWSDGPSLNAGRSEAAVVGTRGSVLVTGGVTAGTVDEYGEAWNHQSYSSTYLFDPGVAPAAWVRQGLLGTARTLPIAATLADGRVLVAGGYYLSGREGATDNPGGIVLAAYRVPGAGAPPSVRPPLDDVAPPTPVPALATAEVFDPATGAWTATAPLRLARIAAPAVTLADGRVLVAGSRPVNGWDYTAPEVDGRAFSTAELYDPAAGRFRLAGAFPEPDWSLLERWGPYPVNTHDWADPGVLVALPDGGALLVGQVISWSIWPLELDGLFTRTLRFDAASNAWSVVDQVVVASRYAEEPTPAEVLVAGHARPGAAAAVLADGRVLIAGGRDVLVAGVDEPRLSDVVDLYDPETGTWYTTDPLPAPRQGGAAVALQDGSLLLIGGDTNDPTCFEPETDDERCDACGEELTGTASVVRFVPGP